MALQSLSNTISLDLALNHQEIPMSSCPLSDFTFTTCLIIYILVENHWTQLTLDAAGSTLTGY